MRLSNEELNALIGDCECTPMDISDNDREQLIAALNQAKLANAHVEVVAVAWMWQHEETGMIGFIEHMHKDSLDHWQSINPHLQIIRPLYAAPPSPSADRVSEEQVTAIARKWFRLSLSESKGFYEDYFRGAINEALERGS
jgi:hypothetical protein